MGHWKLGEQLFLLGYVVFLGKQVVFRVGCTVVHLVICLAVKF